MEVISNSDTARLVLGYLRDQKLEKAASTFIETSSYLKEEHNLMQKGYRLISCGTKSLTDVIRESCEVKLIVNEFIESLPEKFQNEFSNQNDLITNIKNIVKVARKDLFKNLNTIKHKPLKRRHKRSDEEIEQNKEKNIPGYNLRSLKKPRLSNSYLLLKSKASQSTETSDEDARSLCSNSEESDVQQNDESETSMQEEADSIEVPNFPEISEVLLENNEFQNKLVQNINKVLKSAEKNDTSTKETTNEQLTEELDEVIKRILDDTENDPSFENLIKDVICSTSSDNNNLSSKDKNSPKKTTTTTATSTSTTTRSISTYYTQSPPKKRSYVIIQDENNLHRITDDSQKRFETTTGNIISDPSNMSSSLSKLIVINPNETVNSLQNNNTFSTTPLIGEQLLTENNSTNPTILSQFNEPIFIDMTTIPTICMSNDNLPIYIHSDLIQQLQQQQQQQQHDGLTIETSRLVMPPSGLPPGHENNNNNNNVVVLPTPAATAAEGIISKNSFKKIISTNQCPVSLDTRIARDKETPQDGIIPEIQITRSFSTPRRRASHVRALNFTTPLKSTTTTTTTAVESNPKQIINIQQAQQESTTTTTMTTIESPIPKYNLVSEENIRKLNSLQFGEIINTISNNVTASDPNKTNENIGTLKRDDEPTGSRVLSNNSVSEDDNPLLLRKDKLKVTENGTTSTTNKETIKKKQHRGRRRRPVAVAEETKKAETPIDPMEEWKKLRSIKSNQWDQHLRELVSNASGISESKKSKKRRKRKKPKTPAAATAAGENSTESINLNKSNDQEVVLELEIGNGSSAGVGNNNNVVADVKRDNKSPSEEKSNKTQKKNLINFKIPTPIKKRIKDESNRSLQKLQQNEQIQILSPSKQTELIQNVVDAVTAAATTTATTTANKETIVDNNDEIINRKILIDDSQQQILRERERRTCNIGHLLDTPFKFDNLNCPITPRFIVSQATEHNTPITKLMQSCREISLQKNPDVPTPHFAITPGSTLTPKDKETPSSSRSGGATGGGHCWNVCLTDYSSGSSYYRPDESEDLDKHLDSLLKAKRLKEKDDKLRNISNSSSTIIEENEIPIDETSTEETIETVICFKTSSNISKSNENNNQCLENSDDKTHTSNNTSISSKCSNTNNNNIDPFLSMSEIDSSEDDEWKTENVKKTIKKKSSLRDSLMASAVSAASAAAQEKRRYPIRRNRIVVPLQEVDEKLSAEEKKIQHLADLEKKRLRIKEKLKNDFPPIIERKLNLKNKQKIVVRKKIIETPKTKTTNSLLLTKRRVSNRVVNRIQTRSIDDDLLNDNNSNSPIEEEMDVLTALNLSAKPVQTSIIKEPPLPPPPAATIPPPSTSLSSSLLQLLPSSSSTTNQEVEKINNLCHQEANSQDIVEPEPEPKIHQKTVATTTLTTFHKTIDDNQMPSSKIIEFNELQLGRNKMKHLKISSKVKDRKLTTYRRLQIRNPIVKMSSSSSSPKRKEVLLSTAERPITRNMAVVLPSNRLISTQKRQGRHIKFLSQPLPVVRELDFAQKKPKNEPKKKRCSSSKMIKMNKSASSSSAKESAAAKTTKMKIEENLREVRVLLENLKDKSSSTSSKSSKNVHQMDGNELPKEEEEEILKLTISNRSKPIQISEIRSSSSMIEGDDNNSNNLNIIDGSSSVLKSNNSPTKKSMKKVHWQDVDDKIRIASTIENEGSEPDNDDDDDDDDDNNDGDEEDTYDLCRIVTIDERDHHRYRNYCYKENDVSPSSLSLSISRSIDRNKSISSVMNIFIDGEPHILKVTDELLLYTNEPKELHRKKLPRTNDVVVVATEESVEKNLDQYMALCSSTPIQPKFILKHRNRFNTEHFPTTTSTTTSDPSNSNSSSTVVRTHGSGDSSSNKTNSNNIPPQEDDGVSSSTSISQKSPASNSSVEGKILKTEDIYAVLSHLHGNDGS